MYHCFLGHKCVNLKIKSKRTQHNKVKCADNFEWDTRQKYVLQARLTGMATRKVISTGP